MPGQPTCQEPKHQSTSTGAERHVAAELAEQSRGVTTCRPTSGSCGIDWATQQHQICVLDEGDGAVVAERQVAHSEARHRRLVRMVHELSGGHPERVHAGIEVPHGAVVDLLLEREVQVYAINPKRWIDFVTGLRRPAPRMPPRCAGVGRLAAHRPTQLSSVAGAGTAGDPREWSRLTAELQDRTQRADQSHARATAPLLPADDRAGR